MKEETKQMGLMKKLTSALVASSLVFSLVGTAFAAYTPAAGEVAGNRMKDLGIIQGRPEGLALNSEITRAELVTVIVRAFGKEDDAKLLKGSTIFPDIANHWASGNIAMAVALVEKAGSDPIGMPNGKFEPDTKLTPAQAVAFLMKFLGQKADGGKTWPANYLDVAVEKGLITNDDKALIAPMLNENATRGLVFYMFDRAFLNYQLPTGGTFYTTYVDTKAPELNVDAVAETTIDSKVTVTGTVKNFTELYVGTTKVTPAADGKFSAEFALPEIKAEPYTITVTALDLAGNKAEKSQKVARIVGEAKAISAAATLEVEAGKVADLAVSVLDEKNQAIAGAAVTGTSDLGTFENGKFTAGEKAGTGTLTLTAGALTKEVAVTVKAGALAKLVVDPATVDLNAGAYQKFTVKGTDSFGNEVAAPSNVTWTASKGIVGADGTFGATNDATGTVTVTAKVGEVSGTATVNVFGAPAKLALATPASVVANGASKTQLIATIQDVNGNPVKNYTGNISFSITNTAVGTLEKTSVAVTNGMATVDITAGKVVGSAIISATATGLAGATATLTTVAQTPTSVSVKADPASLAADSGSTSTVTLSMLDQDGKAMVVAPSGSWTYAATSSDTNIATITSSGSFALTNGKFVATATATAVNNIGAANLTFTIKKDTTTSTVAANAVTINTQVVGVPHKYAVDPVADAKSFSATATEMDQTVTVRILDANGNQVTGATSVAGRTYSFASIPTLTATSDNGSAVVTPPASFSNGKIVYTVRNAKAETVTYKVSGNWGSVPVAEATATGNFVPGAAAGLVLSANPAKAIAANGTATATLTVKVVDGSASQNLVKDGSYSVTVKRAAGTAITFPETTLTTVDGVATVTVTAGTAVGNTDFQASFKLDNSTVSSNTARVSTAIIGVSNKLAFDGATALLAKAYSGTAGKATTVKVNVLDAAGVVNTLDNTTVVTLKAKDANGAETAYTAVAAGGTASFDVTLNTKGTYTLSAESTGLGSATGTAVDHSFDAASLAVVAADAVGIKITSALDTLQADTVSEMQVKAVLVDEFGNETTAGTKTLADLTTFANSNTSVGTINTWALAGDNKSATANFKVTSLPGTTTLSLSKSGLNGASLTITTVLAAPAAKLAITVDADKKITSTENGNNYQKVTVTVLDAAGNRVTGYAKKVGIAFDGTVSANAKIATAITDPANPTLYTAPVTTTLGGVSFYVSNDKAQSVTYKATAYETDGTTATSTVSTITGTGTFTHGKANNVAVGLASPMAIVGNGSSIAGITAKVVDDKGNTVVNANGNMVFEVNSAFAFIQGGASDGTLTVPVSGGTATVVLQAKNVTSNALVPVKATFKPADTTVTLAGSDNNTNAAALSVVASTDATVPSGTAVWSGNDLTVAYTSADGAFGLVPTFVSTSANSNITGIASVSYTNQTTFTVKLSVATDSNGNALTIPAGATVTVRLADAAGNTFDVTTPAK